MTSIHSISKVIYLQYSTIKISEHNRQAQRKESRITNYSENHQLPIKSHTCSRKSIQIEFNVRHD